ncbi:MAG: hypothetical protein Q9201_005367, partial [Fulgogasparrea decipioides]
MTYSTTTSAHPPSANLSIPTTQNTAPVLSFRCLYTHDLRRKAKRWQDGILKFHTFNNRVMVYDVPRNYIGDTHWHEPQPVQDGDELELDKGVLIQVGEEVERTNTDLTELLERRKAKPPLDRDDKSLQNGSAVDRATKTSTISIDYTAVERPTSTPLAQLRPKSLNALLGKTRGPLGSAVLPTKSPADERREENNHRNEGRSPKRLKLQEAANSTSKNPSARPKKVYPRSEPAERARPSISTLTSTKGVDSPAVPIAEARCVVPTSCSFTKDRIGDDSGPQPRESSRTSQRVDDPNVRGISTSSTSRSHRRMNIQRPRELRVTTHIPPGPTLDRSGGRSQPSKKTRAASGYTLQGCTQSDSILTENVEPDEVSIENEPRPEHLLRISSSKPRKKLLYQDLLPQKAPPSHNVQPPNQHRKESTHSQVHRQLQDPMDDFHEAQREQLQTRPSKRRESNEGNLNQMRLIQDGNSAEALDMADNVPSRKGKDESTFPESLFLTQSSVGGCTPRPSPPGPNQVDLVRGARPDAELIISSSLQPAPPPPPLRSANPPPEQSTTHEEQQPHPKSPEVIKSALPPQKQRNSFHRSASDIFATLPNLKNSNSNNSNNQAPPNRSHTLRKTLSDTPIIPNPPTKSPAPVRTTTNLIYAPDEVPYSRPSTAKE